MERLVLSAEKVDPRARDLVAGMHRNVVEDVARTVERERVVVVGMSGNPHVKRARKLLDDAGVRFTYLEYGSYFSGWKQRLALKLWAGFPTFPMVFVDRTLVGGASELAVWLREGKLKP